MPTYEYACTSCRRHFDVQQSFSDPPLETCEVCGGQLKRVFHPVGIVLKGSGFYATDNRSGKKFTPASKEPGESKSDSKSGSKSESKSGSKSETTGDTKGSKSDGGSATSD